MRRFAAKAFLDLNQSRLYVRQRSLTFRHGKPRTMSAWMRLDLDGRGGALAKLAKRMGGRWGLVAGFVLFDIALQWLGHQLQQRFDTPTVLWPASGLVTAAFWVAGMSWWPVLGAAHIIVESFTLHDNGTWYAPTLIGFADVLESSIGAGLALFWLRERTRVRAYQIGLFLLAAAIGTGAGALVGTLVSTSYLYPGMSYWPKMQLWWIGNWLGTITVAPVLYAWATSLWTVIPELRLRSRLELVAFCVLLPVFTWYVFTAPGNLDSILQLPMLVLAVLALAAFRLPPRWSMTLAAMVVLMVALLAVNHIGVFALRESFSILVRVQAFLATVAAFTAVLASAVMEMRISASHLRVSEYRYRNFVEMSSDAVWCVEMSEPMPITLPAADMYDWLRKHGLITECSRSYFRIDPESRIDRARPARRDSVWADLYRRYIDQVAQHNYSATDFRVNVDMEGKPHQFLASFNGVVEGERLHRIWGVARDVTDLMELNTRLTMERERLRIYARALVTAEERARRATAVDLHDGVGQALVGISMTLEVVRPHVQSDGQLLLDEVKGRLRDLQEQTRNMISDLSPPGLYELGLAPALNWLAVYFRGNHKLDVQLDCRVNEDQIGIELRVQVFKLVRELLRNVHKHAGVSTANVQVSSDATTLRVEVWDEGRGFEWKADMSGTGKQGFGLWSITDRVRELGGELRVDTAPTRGARFEIVFSLPATAAMGKAASLQSAPIESSRCHAKLFAERRDIGAWTLIAGIECRNGDTRACGQCGSRMYKARLLAPGFDRQTRLIGKMPLQRPQ
jgi:signal transduction histidine kinase